MKKRFASTIHSMITSIAVSIIIWVALGAIFLRDPQYVYMMLGVMFFGAVIGGSSIVYDFDNIPFLAQILIHFSLSVLSFLLMNYLNHWMPFTWENVLFSCLLFAIIFFAIWFIYYRIAVSNIRSINHKLKKLHHS